MADFRIPSQPSQIPAPARPEGVRAAQQAFFQAALGRQPAAPGPALAPAARPDQSAGPRPLRPGSLLDIKV